MTQFTCKYGFGHSKKGQTDEEIGAEWIKHFNQQTHHKVDEKQWRLLLVDGHNSHYTLAFLEYALAHKIHILCYPAHGTHIYQGLNVAVFSILKLYWAQDKDKWLREKCTMVNKTNFLHVDGIVHTQVLTLAIIKTAFEKTGVVPFNPNVVMEEMMALSLETSYCGHMPLTPTTPVQIATDLLYEMKER